MRSFLFVPADSERKLARGPQSGADALILDLEDSVVPASRPMARTQARGFLEATGAAGFRRWVRVNPLASSAALDDLAATVPGKPDGILLPKCVPDDLRTLDHYLSAFEAAASLPQSAIRVIAIATETPAAMFALGSYVGVSPRLEGITWGAEDLAACIGGNNRRLDGAYDDVYRLARALCLVAAAAAGVMPIDTIYTDFKDEAGLAAECAAARRSGFTAKMAIHPAQIAVINQAFTAGDDELAWARKVVAVFAENPDVGTVALDGRMVDRPHLTLARRLLGLGAGQGSHPLSGPPFRETARRGAPGS
jgi:citrate lyase subunit beta / citryl-CoA lyase